jgi:ATP-binding cassette subfamily F protein 3
MKWGYGCEIGTYAQHVYSSLDERQTVLENLEYNCDRETTRQEVLAMAGALLFRDEHVNKKVKVLSGGERARLCMAALLLGTANILVLDEPGNHLDVDTVEALADALTDYKGTVIFTSHDRHFMKRVATCVIEVRDGHVVNYRGDYDAYLYMVNKEIDEGERQAAAERKSALPVGGVPKVAKSDNRVARRNEREVKKEMTTVERNIAKLDGEKKALQQQLMNCSDAKEALRLHNEVASLTTQLAEAEERWVVLQEELGVEW